jgi:hypothetical protein
LGKHRLRHLGPPWAAPPGNAMPAARARRVGGDLQPGARYRGPNTLLGGIDTGVSPFPHAIQPVTQIAPNRVTDYANATGERRGR